MADLTESRANTVFMTNLLGRLKSAPSSGGRNSSCGSFDMGQLLSQLTSVLTPRLHLQNGFRQLTASSPDFVHDVLDYLKTTSSSMSGSGADVSAIDILHSAIAKAAKTRCNNQLDDVMHKVVNKMFQTSNTFFWHMTKTCEVMLPIKK